MIVTLTLLAAVAAWELIGRSRVFLPDLFPDPDVFDVDRYSTARHEHTRPGAFAPFGTGVHACLGARFAQSQMMVTLATLLRSLDLAIDPGAYLPSDDSTHGFDNIAGALGISSTLIEAYVNAAGKISRLAIGEPTTPGLVVYRTPEDTSQDYHIDGLPFGTRGGILQKHVFPSDGE